MARWEPPEEQVVEPRKAPRWPMVVLLLALLAVAGTGLWMFRRRLRPPPRLDAQTTAENVRSDVTAAGDSLEVRVSWRVAQPMAADLADSVRVEVGLGDGRESRSRVSRGDRRTDTLRLRIPAPGETASGYSCVALVRGAHLSRESCTPWQFVRPSAQLPTPPGQRPAPPAKPAKDSSTGRPAKQTAAPAGDGVARIVVEPSGQQVDPDIGGRCADWQRRNPKGRVWIDVNREAIPECTGPNGKPTVAQFCAFAVLGDGRRVKTENSTNDPYCERLFQIWSRERVT